MPAPLVAAAATRALPQAGKAVEGAAKAPKPAGGPPGGAPPKGEGTPKDFGHGKPEATTLDKVNTGANVVQTGAMVKDMMPQPGQKPQGEGEGEGNKPKASPVS